MWAVFKTFVDQFRNRSPLPLFVWVDREEVSYIPLSKKQNTFVHFSFSVFVLHTVYCFLRLLWLWKIGFRPKKQDQDLKIIRIYLLVFFMFLPLSFASMAFVLTRRSTLFTQIMNPIKGLKKFGNGNTYLVFLVFK